MPKRFGLMTKKQIRQREPKWEIKKGESWLVVDRYIFRSWTGERRVNGKPYKGRVFVLGTSEPV